MKMYEMEMKFKATIGLKEINDFMHMMGFKEELKRKHFRVYQVMNISPR